jgi:hypothetical protein
MVVLVCSLVSLIVIACLAKVLAAIHIWLFHVYPFVSFFVFFFNIMLIKSVTMALFNWNRSIARHELKMLS